MRPKGAKIQKTFREVNWWTCPCEAIPYQDLGRTHTDSNQIYFFDQKLDCPPNNTLGVARNLVGSCQKET